MATKLKKLTRNILFKISAFILILACAFIFMLSFHNLNGVKYFESILQPDFMQSEELGYNFSSIVNKVSNLLETHKSGDKARYDRVNKELNANKGLYYFATDGSNIVNNTDYKDKDFFTSKTSYILIEGDNLTIHPYNNNISRYFYNYIYDGGYYDNEYSDNHKYYIAFTDNYLEPLISEWNSDRNLLIYELTVMGIMFLVALIAFIYLVVTAGKSGYEDEIKLAFIDKLYTDINVISLIFIITFGLMGYYEVAYNFYDSYLIQYIAAGIVTMAVALSLVLILSLIRHLKNHTFIKHSFVYSVLNKIYRVFTAMFASGPMMLKAIILVAGFGLACMIGTVMFPLGLLVIAVGMYFVYLNVSRFKQIKYCVKSVKEGELAHKTIINGNSELARFSRDINSIAEGLEKAVSNEVKSERMKSELITNVSHDIKTPLTSIINYVDLLKKEGMNSENAPKYLEILEKKSLRLKALTEDLFEAAKASSGDMPVNLEKVDIFSLMQQGLAELDDKIEQSGLHFKINVPDEKVYVLADGKLLWRVIENLLSNVFKYALKDSRVYIDIIDSEESDKNVILTVKNISSYELNIAVEELMERFKRADESRSSEGSGLGLAIAKNLMEIQKGSLNLEIDGDLFKATVTVPKFI